MTTEQKTEYTPGPWEVFETMNKRGQELPPKIIQEGKPGFIAILGFASEGDRSANARLIAAAPFLIEAVKGLLENLPERRDWLDPDVERFAKAAIAKATGEGA